MNVKPSEEVKRHTVRLITEGAGHITNLHGQDQLALYEPEDDISLLDWAGRSALRAGINVSLKVFNILGVDTSGFEPPAG